MENYLTESNTTEYSRNDLAALNCLIADEIKSGRFENFGQDEEDQAPYATEYVLRTVGDC